jgi:hypothetical protein
MKKKTIAILSGLSFIIMLYASIIWFINDPEIQQASELYIRSDESMSKEIGEFKGFRKWMGKLEIVNNTKSGEKKAFYGVYVIGTEATIKAHFYLKMDSLGKWKVIKVEY